IVVELLAAQPNRDRGNVPALVLHLEVPIAERMADAVHDTRGPERNPHHLHGPDERSNEKAEQIDVRAEHDDDPEPVQAAEQDALDPIVRRPLAVLLEHAGLANRAAVVERTFEDDVAQPLEEWAMGIAFAVGERVVLTMAGDPLFRDNRRREPEP